MIVTDEKTLRQISEPVASFEDAKEIVEKLKAQITVTPDAVGLAAIQIGIPKRVFLAYGSTGKLAEKGWNIWVNPRIEEVFFPHEKMLYAEGCLSFPGVVVQTNRPRHILISALGEDGERHKWTLNDEDAVIFQHELDHLDGVLMFDRKFVMKPVTVEKTIGRNDPCHCGSGKKYKKCHGAT